VRDLECAREIGQKDEARLQRRDQEGLALGVLRRDLRSQLRDSCGDLLRRQVEVADARIGG